MIADFQHSLIVSVQNFDCHNHSIFSDGLMRPRELIELARARPGQLTYGTASPTGFQRLAAERLKLLAKIDIVNVPYQGGSAR